MIDLEIRIDEQRRSLNDMNKNWNDYIKGQSKIYSALSILLQIDQTDTFDKEKYIRNNLKKELEKLSTLQSSLETSMKTISRDLKRDKQNLNLTTKETTETKQKPTGDCTVEQLIELKTEEEVNKLLSNQNNLNTHRIKLKNENDRPNATERTNLENDMNIQQMEGNNKQAKVIESKGLQLTQQLQIIQDTINSIRKEH